MADKVEWPLPVGVHFSVKLGNSTVAFSEVSGLETSIETKEVHSGGDNSTVYHLPQKVKFSDLVLKRAVLCESDPLYRWCTSSMNSMTNAFRVTPKSIEVTLLDEKNTPLATWTFNGAYPVKWSFSTLNAMKGEIMIETLTMKYWNVKRTL